MINNKGSMAGIRLSQTASSCTHHRMKAFPGCSTKYIKVQRHMTQTCLSGQRSVWSKTSLTRIPSLRYPARNWIWGPLKRYNNLVGIRNFMLQFIQFSRLINFSTWLRKVSKAVPREKALHSFTVLPRYNSSRETSMDESVATTI